MLIESLSHSSTDPLNTFKYNGIHFEREGGLNSYIAPFRTLDPTIARWSSVDPMNQFLNPYVSMGGDPVSFSDPLGLEVPLNPKNFSVPENDRPRKGYLDAGFNSAYDYARALVYGRGASPDETHGTWNPTSFVDASGDKWAEVWLTIAAWENAHCTGDLDWSEYSVGSYGTIEYQQFSYKSVIIRHYGASGNEGIVVAYPLFEAVFVPNAEAGNSGATGIKVNGLSTANGLFGTAVGFGEVSTLAGQGKYITSKGLIRDINFTKLTQHSTPYATAGKLLKSWGRGSAVLGFAVDGYAYRKNQISGAHFGINTGVTIWGLGVGAAGMAVPAFIGGALYFGIDTFYPGGFDGAMQMNGSLIEQNQQILGPRFNLYRDH